MPPRLMDRSDPEILRHYNKSYQRSLQNAKEPYPAELLALCRSDYLDTERVIMIEWIGNILYFKSDTIQKPFESLLFLSE